MTSSHYNQLKHKPLPHRYALVPLGPEYACPFCKEPFEDAGVMRDHLKEQHPKQGKYFFVRHLRTPLW